ncbi:MAG: hypothetical protein L0332_03015 [Chloroflexi bacterium]|nr:hypothetical protein [Chloroflexota bacterium]MCI0577172.1 hypothetical protein [Chloroflexota bacterium]MCI0649911.1 hypothetical protein [Chloroflexota bacterium]MCI0725681.1 hypothetical protein [Chloroflexota bacterium]
MKGKRVLLLLPLVAILILGAVFSVAEAGIDGPSANIAPHPPRCVADFSSDALYVLTCTDRGKDIIGMQVKSNTPYELTWNAEGATLTVQLRKDTAFMWTVVDKAGSRTSGKYPLDTAEASSDGVLAKVAPHPPECYRVDTFIGDVYQLYCTDDGKDIGKVAIKSNSPYQLIWDEAEVSLTVYLRKDTAFSWAVMDKAGSRTTGHYPN